MTVPGVSPALLPRLGALALSALLIAGCGTTKTGDPTGAAESPGSVASSPAPSVEAVPSAIPTTSPTPTASPDPTAPDAEPPGLRGIRLTTGLSCEAAPWVRGREYRRKNVTLTPVTGDVEMLRFCPVPDAAGDVYWTQRDLRRGSARFARAAREFALADTHGAGELQIDEAPEETICLTYGDTEVNVLALTSDGTWALHLPLNQCGHYLPGTSRLLGRILYPESP
jgi:hypothetical protein